MTHQVSTPESARGVLGDAATIGMSLMKGEESTATVEYVRDAHPHVQVYDQGTYYRLEATSEIRIDVSEVGDYLGSELHMRTFLGLLASYYGRIDVEGDVVVVTSEMLQLTPRAGT